MGYLGGCGDSAEEALNERGAWGRKWSEERQSGCHCASVIGVVGECPPGAE